MDGAARVPVYMRIGTGDEHVIGSLNLVPLHPSQQTVGEPIKFRVDGGAPATAALLEAAAAELRRAHAEGRDPTGS